MESHNSEKCAFCEEASDCLKRCSGCQDVRYCSSNCQKKDWENHKEYCKSHKKLDHNQQEEMMNKLMDTTNKLGSTFCEAFRDPNPDEKLDAMMEMAFEGIGKGNKRLEKKAQKKKEKVQKRIDECRAAQNESVVDFLVSQARAEDDNDPYGDGDQSPLKGMDAVKMKYQWGNGMGYRPEILSDWGRACFFGCFDEVKRICETSDDPNLVEKRESYLRLPGVIHVIAGARLLKNGEHMKCFKYLVKERKCRLDCRDVAGMTPLHHCLSGIGNDLTKDMARILLERGVDPDARNRNGEGPVFEIVMAGKLDFMDLLIEFDVNVDVYDNSGHHLPSMARLYPAMTAKLSKAMQKTAKNIRAEAKAEQAGCAHCGSKSKSLKQCGSCYDVRYCGSVCQKEHWKAHKDDCKATRANYKPISLMEYKGGLMATFNYRKQTVASGSGWSKLPDSKIQFVVKVQVPMDVKDTINNNRKGRPVPKKEPLMLYNQDKSLCGLVTADCPSYDEMVKTVLEHKYSVHGIKGYMSAIYEPGKGVQVNVKKLVKPEKW